MWYPTLAAKRVAVLEEFSKICYPASQNLVQFWKWICLNSLSCFSAKCKELLVSRKVIVWRGTTVSILLHCSANNACWFLLKSLVIFVDNIDHIYHHCNWRCVYITRQNREFLILSISLVAKWVCEVRVFAE